MSAPSFEQLFGDLRSAAQSAPDALGWRRVCWLLDAMAREHSARLTAEALPYIERAVAPWPAALKIAPAPWLAQALDDQPPAALALCRALSIDLPRLTAEQARTLAQTRALAHVERLSWRVQELSNGALRALLAAPWIARLREIELMAGVPSVRQSAQWLAQTRSLERLTLRAQTRLEEVTMLHIALGGRHLKALRIEPSDGGWTDRTYWRAMADADWFGGLESLDVRPVHMSGDALGGLVERARELGRLARLKALHLGSVEGYGGALTALAALIGLPSSLEVLTLPERVFSPEELARLISPSADWSALVELTLPSLFDHHGAVTDWLGEQRFASLRALTIPLLLNVSFQSFLDWMHAPWMRQLERLTLRGCQLPQRAWRDASVGQALASIVTLSLEDTEIAADGARGLARHALSSLRALDLSGALPAEALPALVEAPWWDNLERLSLCKLGGPEGLADALGDVQLGSRLASLDLSYAQVDMGALTRMFGRSDASRLRELILDGTSLASAEPDALVALLDRLPALERLSLRETGLSEQAWQALDASGHAARLSYDV